MSALIDTHVHFDEIHAKGEVAAVLARAHTAGVGNMVAMGGSVSANDCAVELAAAHAGVIRAAIGLDRDQIGSPSSVEAWLGKSGVCAVGEIGLDYYYSFETAAAQRELFERMLTVAREARLPVVVHSRYADDDTLRLLRAHAEKWSGSADRIGVLHCFTGTREFAREVLACGFMVSFSGIITFANAVDLRNVVPHIPLERLLVETDTPFLAPVPWRGKRNEPAYVRAVAEKLAELRGIRLAQLAEITTRNAKTLFGFS